MEFKRIWILLIMAVMFVSIANAGLISLEEKNIETIDAVFPELIYNTDNCDTNCEAQFKYCLDGDNEIELSFEESIGDVSISYGYYTNESYEDPKDYCSKYETVIENKTEEKEVCIETSTYYETVYYQQWHDGLPSQKLGCHDVTIKGIKKIGSSVDWIPTLTVKGFLWDTKYIQEKWAWWSGTYTYKNQYFLNSTVTTDLVDYQYYIEIDTATLISAGKMNSDCSDLRIINESEDAVLYYEIANNTCNTATTGVWFNKPLLKSDNTSFIYLYYGNAGASDGQDPDNLWGVDNYKIRIPCDEEESTPFLYDSTNWSNHLTMGSGAGVGEAGVFGNACRFNGTSNSSARRYVDDNEFDLGLGDYTLSIWVKTADSGHGTFQNIMTSNIDSAPNRYYLNWDDWPQGNGSQFAYFVTEKAGQNTINSDPVPVDTNTWRHITGVRNNSGTTQIIYIDGKQITFTTGASKDMSSLTTNFGLGSETTIPDALFDEARMYNKARSYDEIKMDYAIATQTLYYGAGEEQAISITFTFKANNNTLPNQITLFGSNITGSATNVSGFWFSTNNTGSWINDSWVEIDAQTGWGNTTKTLNDTCNIDIGYKWYANDSSGTIYESSETVFLTNCEPIIQTINITNTTGGYYFIKDADLKGYANATDQNQNNVTYNCLWYFDGVGNQTGSLENQWESIEVNVDNITASWVGDYIFSCYVNDTFENSTQVNSSAVTVYDFVHTTKTSSVEKATINFWINYTGISPTYSEFSWNGTWYNASLLATDSWRYQQVLPAVTEDVNLTYGYRWFDGEVEYSFFENITVQNIGINTDGNGTLIYNVTFFDEQTEADITPNMTMNTIFTLIFSDGTTEDVSFNTTGNANFYLDINQTFTSTIQFQYEKDGYQTREYFLYQQVISNDTFANLSLADINTTESSGIVISVKDYAYRELQDVYIGVQRFYVSSNSYETIAMGKTDENGVTRIYLEPNDVYYIFTFSQDGELLQRNDPALITSSTADFVIDTSTLTPIFAYQNVNVLVTFNNATKTWQVTLDDLTGTYDALCYTMTKLTVTAETEICNDCVVDTASTFVCSDPSYSATAQYSLSVKGFGSSDFVYFKSDSGDGWSGIVTQGMLGITGFVLTGFIVLSAGALGVFNPVAGLILAFVGLALSTFTGFIVLSYGTLVVIAVSFAILIWRMSR